MIDFSGKTVFILGDGPSAGRYKSLDKLRGRPGRRIGHQASGCSGATTPRHSARIMAA